MCILKKAYKSKTMWLSLATAILGAIIATMPLFQETVKPETYGYIFMALSVLMAIIRVYTTTSLDDK